jgi:hypothetical protein
MVWDDNNDFGAHVRRVGYWTQLEHERMDAAFCTAMQRAGHAITAPSTYPGTRTPIAGYQRSE